MIPTDLLPIPEPEHVIGANRRVELPGVAAVVAADEQLSLTMTAVSGVNPGRLHSNSRHGRAGGPVGRRAADGRLTGRPGRPYVRLRRYGRIGPAGAPSESL
jgi:hypothetical protein